MRIWLTVMLCAAALLSSTNSGATDGSPGCHYDHDHGYRVDDDVIVRTGPAASRRFVYELPSTARAIRCVGPCRKGWCRIRWHGVVGWIPRQHLVEDGTVAHTTDPYP